MCYAYGTQNGSESSDYGHKHNLVNVERNASVQYWPGTSKRQTYAYFLGGPASPQTTLSVGLEASEIKGTHSIIYKNSLCILKHHSIRYNKYIKCI